MTKWQQAEYVRNALGAKGYSKKYIDRVLVELWDHHSTLVEHTRCENGPATCDADQRLGIGATFLEAFDHYPELKPWPQRHPLATFVLAPGLALCSISFAATISAEWLTSGAMIPVADLNPVVFQIHWGLVMLVVAAASALLVYGAIHSRVPWSFVVVASSLIALNGTYVNDFGSCRASSSAVVYSHFGFDWWRTLTPISFGLFGVLVAIRQNRPALGNRNKNINPMHSPTWLARLAPGQTTSLVGLTLLAMALFVIAIPMATHTPRSHRADKLLQGLNSEAKEQEAMLALLAMDVVATDLELSDPQRTIIAQSIDKWRRFNHDQQTQHLSSRPTVAEYKEFAARILNPELKEVCKKIRLQMTTKQQQRLSQIRFQFVGNNIYFFPSVQDELNLTALQMDNLKDLYIQEIRRTSKWRIQLRKGNQAAIAKLHQARNWHDEQIAGILHPRQTEKLKRIRGKPLELPIQF